VGGVRTLNLHRSKTYTQHDLKLCRNSANFVDIPVVGVSSQYSAVIDPDNEIEELYEWNNYGPCRYPECSDYACYCNVPSKKILYVPITIKWISGTVSTPSNTAKF